MSGLGWRAARDEHERARRQVEDLLFERLRDASDIAEDFIQRLQREAQQVADRITLDRDAIRRIVRETPIVDQIFVLNSEGSLVHPDPAGPLNASERRFLSDFGDVFLQEGAFRESPENQSVFPSVGRGWITHYHGPGLQLIFWQQTPSGGAVGILIPRARWISELIAALPETSFAEPYKGETAIPSRISLLDSNGRSTYEWGSLPVDSSPSPLQELPLPYPLSAWRLQHHVETDVLAAVGRGAYLNLISILAAGGVILVVGGLWLFREYNRNLRESMQRVSFVNQVSHELKTPLTNIRMYAELLENDVDDADDTPIRDHLKVIVEESQRLSRLIANVLTFAKEDRNGHTLRLRPGIVDDVMKSVITHFEPSFRRRRIEIEYLPGAGNRVNLDADAIEQIVSNLLSNVEKYAASGERVEISSQKNGDETIIIVRDHGPGIPARHMERIFQPFNRLSDAISDSPGTGIGLTISRQMARRHGGDLRAVPCPDGAQFEIRLHTPPCSQEATS
jgi:signal transduction histidine kinase